MDGELIFGCCHLPHQEVARERKEDGCHEMSEPALIPSISVAEKPSRHISTEDWVGHVNDLKLLACDKRDNAHVIRSETRQARNETTITSAWKHHDNNVKLGDRMAEVQQWLEILAHARCLVDREVDRLTEEKLAAEREIEAYYRALSVVSECLLLRDRRSTTDLTYDDPHKQLNTELKLLEASKAELTGKCHEAWELMTRGRELSSQIGDNVADKMAARDIDASALELDVNSALTSNKPDVLRTPQGVIAHESWVQTAQSIQADADTLCQQSAKLREAMCLARDRANMEYLCQVENTNYALRRRLHNANRLFNELQWQRKNTLEEMARVQSEVDRLRACTEQHTALLKCAETRQENRNHRPGAELVRDEPHDGLLAEITQLRQALRELRDKTDTAVCTYNELENLVVKLDGELAAKELCIQMEMRTLDARSNLIEHQPITELDKETVLVKMDKQLAPLPIY